MKKNYSMFFVAATLGVVAVFIFSITQAQAYAIGTGTTQQSTGTNYTNVAGGLQNLFSPFTGFIRSLQWTTKTNITIHNSNVVMPSVDITPWLSQFDNWFYGITKVRLSGIIYAGLNAIAWVLGLAENVMKWLLSLFRIP